MNAQNKQWKNDVLTVERFLNNMTKKELIKYCVGLIMGIQLQTILK